MCSSLNINHCLLTPPSDLNKLNHKINFVCNFIFLTQIGVNAKLHVSIKIFTHQNPLIKNLFTQTLPGNSRRRLKRNWCRDLLENSSREKEKKRIYVIEQLLVKCH
ncbi:Uncharacterized protein FWK35_00023677 [Aphis craccivora]|uniref:Uncharacterized protein n=1 Tax=Aphis craccivora TaxID=307492 RepID=A0A6G0ZGB5_APHCR|nr:Uncharacterized protein FWK35_00023677 [Aphis craccivora]